MADTPEKDDRTEEPTQRRLDQAIERGDVAKSQEINTFFVLGGFALAILVLSGPVARTRPQLSRLSPFSSPPRSSLSASCSTSALACSRG